MNEADLPKAPLVWMNWHWWWFGTMAPKRILRVERGYRWQYVKLRLWNTTRGANFAQVFLGPLWVGWRRPYGEAYLGYWRSKHKST